MHTWGTRIFIDEWNLKVIGLNEEKKTPRKKVVWAQVLSRWFLPVAYSRICSCCCGLDAKSSLTLWDQWTVARKTPRSIGFSRQECWSALPFPSPGHFPDLGIKPKSPALAGRFVTTESYGNSHCITILDLIKLYILYESFQEAESPLFFHHIITHLLIQEIRHESLE